MLEDVPSPIDYRVISEAREWEATSMEKRPWRTEIFERFVSEIASSRVPVRRVLELGSGPGFLAFHVLRAIPDVSYVALDFSPAMHRLANARLGLLASKVEFVERTFKDGGWSSDLGAFDCVLTNQAVHELRHTRYAVGLHTEVRRVLATGGSYLLCDHFSGEGGMTNEQLYMSVEEQQSALRRAGFAEVELLLLKGGLVLHRATSHALHQSAAGCDPERPLENAGR
jgi:SAM-dependent methyltransferase